MTYEIAIVDGVGRCRLRKLIPMVSMPHIGPSGTVSSNLPIYHRKVDIYEGTADECRSVRDVLASNSVLGGPKQHEQDSSGSVQDEQGEGPKP